MASKTFTPPRGMKDTEPDEMKKRLWLYDRIREVVIRYGFQMVEPTTVEDLRTLEARSGPGIRNEIYWFKDKGGRNLGLRFDLTVGLARMVANRSDLPEPIKFATIGGNWRYEEPQFARYRYHTQWDIEIFGSNSPYADAEVISVGANILNNVGLKEFTIRISNRKLIQGYLDQLGIRGKEKLDQCLRIIDKVRKVGPQQLAKEFGKAKVKKAAVTKILSFITLNGSPEVILKKLETFDFQNQSSKKGVEELRILSNGLESLGALGSCIYDLSIVRGIGYYDGIVFEAFDKEGEDVGSIFGGGRYDGLCKVYGKRDIAATGVAGGIERLMISLERGNLFPKSRLVAKAFIATVKENLRPEADRLAQNLRENGVATEIDLKGRPLGGQLEYANSTKIPYVVVVGQKEVQSQMVKIKDMATRVETEVSFAELPAKLAALP